MTFGERLLITLKRREMSKLQLAQMTGVSSAQISQYTADHDMPGGLNLIKIAEALEIDPAWLMLGRRIRTRPLRDDDHEA